MSTKFGSWHAACPFAPPEQLDRLLLPMWGNGRIGMLLGAIADV